MSVDTRYLGGKTLTSFHKPTPYTRVYSKNYEKAVALEFEVDRNRDIIMKLKNDLSNKNKELYLLKVNKNTLEEEHLRTLKTLKEFLKKSDNLTKETYKTIEKNVNENKNFIPDSDNEAQSEEIFNSPKKKWNKQNKNKKKMKDFIRIDSLKQHIYNLNEELNKKNNLITELKNNKKATGYKELQNNFLSSCNEIKEMKKENMEYKNKIDNVTNLLIIERDDNKFLKNKLQEYKKRFEIFKELSINKVKQLDNELNLAKEKERNFKIRKTGERNKEKWNEYIKNLEYNDMKRKINDYQLDIKKNNDIIKKYKSSNFAQNEQKKKLQNDMDDLLKFNEMLKLENEELKSQINEYKIKVKNYEKEKKEWKEKEKENNKLKKEIEELKSNLEKLKNKNKIFFTDIENKKDEEENKIEEEKNEEEDKNVDNDEKKD